MVNKKYPKISIVTPSYNQGEFIEKTIKSVLSQDYFNFEYVIIDGDSTDQSKKIIEKYKKKLKYYESKKDRGQSHAINKGFAKTNGEIMAWINSDDVLQPGALRLVASIFENFPEIEWVSSLPSTINSDGYLVYLARPPLYLRPLIRKGLYIRKFCGFIMQEGTFWRRSLWNKAGSKLEEVPYTMDMKLWQEFSKHAQLYPIKSCLASYRLNPNRKNNDGHKNYYLEMDSRLPKFLALPFNILWRLIAIFANICMLSPIIYFDTDKLIWKFRKNLFNVKSFKLLSNIKPR